MKAYVVGKQTQDTELGNNQFASVKHVAVGFCNTPNYFIYFQVSQRPLKLAVDLEGVMDNGHVHLVIVLSV